MDRMSVRALTAKSLVLSQSMTDISLFKLRLALIQPLMASNKKIDSLLRIDVAPETRVKKGRLK
jgi:hypothetical protein